MRVPGSLNDGFPRRMFLQTTAAAGLATAISSRTACAANSSADAWTTFRNGPQLLGVAGGALPDLEAAGFAEIIAPGIDALIDAVALAGSALAELLRTDQGRVPLPDPADERRQRAGAAPVRLRRVSQQAVHGQ